MELLLWGIVARAQELYPVRICHLQWMGNHFHLILTVGNPDDVPAFMRFVKGESAAAINKLLGRRARSVWCDGYDEPVLLTGEDVIRYIVYLYANPLTANLVAAVDAYPGVSTWKMYRSGRCSRRCKHIPRSAIPALPDAPLSESQERALVRLLKSQSEKESRFLLEPDAWMECFEESASWDKDKVRRRVIKEIRELEAELLRNPERKVLGAEALRKEDIRQLHQPKKFSRRMICISLDKELRKGFISWAKTLFFTAREVYRRWKQGDYSVSFPPGLFPPSVPKRG